MLGRTLSHYQVLAILGQGGMGEVYKARDTRLNRFVALKVLKAELLSNAARKQRFIQEAQAASALNHPNIVTVHDVFEHEGIDCLVMEYIDGKTLDALIPHQGIRLNEALRIAVQIAEGLRKAHSAGIIHRDIKPSNIIVANDGPVKILDFGLAKLTESGASASDEDTRTQRPDTEEGTVMGTVAYMSPEQAEGTKVDVRSDIFSFGALLYEIITGRRAFPGNSKLSTMSAILKEEPKPVENVPPDLEKIIRRCLRKDRDKRYQHMDDLKLALEEVREDSESGKLTPAKKPSAPLSWIAVASATVLIAAGGFYWWRSRETKPTPTGYSLKQITSDSGLSTTPAISPDGRLIAYASDRQTTGNLDIWVQPLTANARPIRLTTHSSDDLAPSFSPDSGTIAFFSKRDGGGIYVVPALGGEERLVAKGKVAQSARPRFSPDGKSIVYASGSYLMQSQVVLVPSSGGALTAMQTNLAWTYNPVWSPDGRHVAMEGRKTMDSPSHIWIIPVDGSVAVDTGIESMGQLEDWVPGFLTVSRQRSAWAYPIADGSFKVGPATKLVESTAGLRYSRALGDRAAGPDRIVFAGETVAEHLWSLALDSNTAKVRGDPVPLPHVGGRQTAPSMDGSGRFLAYTQDAPGRSEVRVLELASGKDSALVSGFARAKLSPDGSTVAYRNTEGLFTVDRSGGTPVKLLNQAPDVSSNLYAWHPHGIVYWHGSPIRFSLLDTATKVLHELISHPTSDVHGAELSPDGKWLTFHVPGTAREPIYVARILDGKAAPQPEWILLSDSPGVNRRGWWSEDGNVLYWISERDGPLGIWAQRLTPDKHPLGPPFAVLRFQATRQSPYNLGLAQFGPAVARDRLIYALLERSGNIWLAEANK